MLNLILVICLLVIGLVIFKFFLYQKLYDQTKRKVDEKVKEELTLKIQRLEDLQQEKELEIEKLKDFKEKQKTIFKENLELEKKIFERDFLEEKEKKQQELNNYIKETEEIIEDFHQKRLAINELVLKEKQKQEQESFYMIQIPEKDREDIALLNEIKIKFNNRNALSKIIWDLYINRPTLDMIKRVTNNKTMSGIYKITYIKTGESYIGKTTNIKTRWTNHVKTAIGLDAAARATIHTRMEKDGLWNYSFEILEEVEKDKLTEREKYYIKLYDTTSQLNIREG